MWIDTAEQIEEQEELIRKWRISKPRPPEEPETPMLDDYRKTAAENLMPVALV